MTDIKIQLASKNPDDRYDAIDGLQKVSTDEASDLLIKELRDYGYSELHGVVANEAIRVLGKRKDQRAVLPLIQVMVSPERTIRITKVVRERPLLVNVFPVVINFTDDAAKSLGEIGNDAATSALIGVVMRECSVARQQISTPSFGGFHLQHADPWPEIEALGKIGNPKAVDAIIAVIRATNTSVASYSDGSTRSNTGFVFSQNRRTYYAALQHIRSEATTKALLRLITDPSMSKPLSSGSGSDFGIIPNIYSTSSLLGPAMQ